MSTPESSALSSPRAAQRVAFGVLWVTWAVIRLPALALMVILEPLVRVLLAGSALLLTLTAFFYKLVMPHAPVPFWGMLGIAVGCVMILALYYALLRVLSA